MADAEAGVDTQLMLTSMQLRKMLLASCPAGRQGLGATTFTRVLAPITRGLLTKHDIRMWIDVDCDGVVDWDEFIGFLMLVADQSSSSLSLPPPAVSPSAALASPSAVR